MIINDIDINEIINKIIKSKDHYEILNCTNNCDKKEIKKQYKKLSVLIHPDKNNNVLANEAFIKLNTAYNCLYDDILRNDYDNNKKNNIDIDFITILIFLKKWGVTVPPEEKWPEFQNYVYSLVSNEEIKKLYQTKIKYSFITFFALSRFYPSLLFFCVSIAIGPIALTSSLLWEEIVTNYNNKNKYTISNYLSISKLYLIIFGISSATAVKFIFDKTYLSLEYSKIYLYRIIYGELKKDNINEWVYLDNDIEDRIINTEII